MITTDKVPFDILLVEDDMGDAGLVRVALSEGHVHCRIHHVKDGVEAMDFLHRRGAHADAPAPDLMLLDLNMPRMDGREVLKQVKSDPDLQSLPVVVLTTSDVERDIDASYRLGANSFITKPVDIEQFCAAIRSIEDYWFGIVKLPSR